MSADKKPFDILFEIWVLAISFTTGFIWGQMIFEMIFYNYRG